jgi:hypothetical protein
MMCGQIEQPEGMLCPIGQDPQSEISDACENTPAPALIEYNGRSCFSEPSANFGLALTKAFV